MPAKKKPLKSTAKISSGSFLTSRLSSNRITVIIIGAAFAVIGLYFVFNSRAAAPPQPFVDAPERGLVWAGLKSGKADGLCAHLYEVVDQAGRATGCTHGPDPAPEGVDVRQSVAPVKTGENDFTAGATTAGTTAAASLTPCDGDGVSGARVQGLYVRASDKPSRYNSYASSFQTWGGYVNSKFVESGLQTGSARNVRWVHDSNCQLIVSEVVISPTGDDNYSATVSELRNLGYNRSDRKYMLWVDANVYCGIAGIYGDDKATLDNINNTGPSYNRSDAGCWGYAEPHELMHNLGGVQLSAPNTSRGYHCTDEYDVMCYSDAPGVTMTYRCPSSEEQRFDCNKDDFFHSGTPPVGSYLATKWNTANSSFLIGGGTTPPPPPPPSDTVSPDVRINSPLDGATVSRSTSISATASDNLGVVKMEIYLDGALKSASTTSSISYNWNARKASTGNHVITVKAYDAVGNIGQSTVTVRR